MHPSSPSLRLKYYAVSGNGIGRGTEKGRKEEGEEKNQERGREGKEEEKRNASSSLPLLKGFL